MKTLILALPGAEELGESLAQQLHCGAIPVEIHRFPDGEQRVRLCAGIEGCRVLLAAHLDHPDDKTLPLVFAAEAARELGAAQVGLVAPYLPYMRHRTPVLVDDIVSTGQTLIAAAQALRSAGWGAPTAVTVHALMEREDVEALHRAGVPRIVSCDTVTHPSNAISVRGLLAEALRGMLA